MTSKIKSLYNQYPPQFWLIAFGVLVSSIGSSIIWPFQIIYISEKLNNPITTVATLISIGSLTGLLISFVGGFVADRVGRKPIMFIAQAAHGIGYLFMSSADSYSAFLLPMIIMGASMPFYAIGSDAMMADMISPQDRNNAYSVLRIINNAGIAIGPAIGGLLVSRSYALAFYAASIGMLAYSLLLLFFVRETLVRNTPQPEAGKTRASLGGYEHVLKDSSFVRFVLMVALGMIAPLMMWTLLAIYTKDNYGLPENLYSWLPVTNALMCVFVQYFVTMFTRKHHSGQMIALGMFVYAIGVGSVALMTSFWGFWVSMVILTFGELILVPTASVYVANLAPEEYRGRYMTIYWLTWGLARAFAPIIGGFINDAISPRAIWVGGLLFGLTSAFGLFLISNSAKSRATLRT
ncbi:MAG: MFS transporter [Chloroflexi bacterium]|nr:MFS transporter [Chloroflexota bacterium]